MKLQSLSYLSITFLIAVVIVAHFFVPPSYHWSTNTLSELASQGLPFQWIMQVGFIGFGILLNIGIIAKNIRALKFDLGDLFVGLYGVCVLVTGFYSASPFLPDVVFDAQEALIHSRFASYAGFLLSAGIVTKLFTTRDDRLKTFHMIFLLLVMCISALFGSVENGSLLIGRGLVQRTLWLVSFFWLWVTQKREIQKSE